MVTLPYICGLGFLSLKGVPFLSIILIVKTLAMKTHSIKYHESRFKVFENLYSLVKLYRCLIIVINLRKFAQNQHY